jgi:S-formylglutathione hydrolase FrmB
LRALIAGSLAALGLLVAAVAADATPPLHNADGLQVSNVTQLDSRLLEATVTTDALPGPAHVRILLPEGYESEPSRRYPVLYLLHGTSGGAADWTRNGGAEQSTAGQPLIVVMPDVALNKDGGGWCTNWVNGGARGVPEWERFHVGQLIPWIDGNLRTVATRGDRAIGGLSQGGFCALSYAVRHPDLFSTVLSFSGVPDIAYGHAALARSIRIFNQIETELDHAPANSMFGDPLSDEINWATHDPATMAGNLRGMNVRLYWGNGEPGPLEEHPDRGLAWLEALVNEYNVEFRDRMQALGVPAYFDAYGPGTHSFPYWSRDLRESIGPLMASFADPAPAPANVTYTTAEGRYTVYGWTVAMHRTAEEFSWLNDAGSRRFALAGSGSASVLTPPRYVPGARYRLRMRVRGAVTVTTLVADSKGRLHVALGLGPPNPYQQDTPQASAAGTAVYTTSVSIARVSPRAARCRSGHGGRCTPPARRRAG